MRETCLPSSNLTGQRHATGGYPEVRQRGRVLKCHLNIFKNSKSEAKP